MSWLCSLEVLTVSLQLKHIRSASYKGGWYCSSSSVMPFSKSQWSVWKGLNGTWTQIWGPHALQKLKSRSWNHTWGHLNNSEAKWHAGTVANMQWNCQEEFIFAWHCDTLCLLACNLSLCTSRWQKKPLSPLCLAPPLPSRSRIHSTYFTVGRDVRACSVSVANQPCRAVSFDGEKSLSLLERRSSDSGGGMRCGWICEGEKGGLNELATQLNCLLCHIRPSIQIWQEMQKQSVPLNVDNSTSSRI